MRRFLLLLALAPSLAVAQPTAADSALVGRLLSAQGFDDAGASVSPWGEHRHQDLIESAQAALFEDFQPLLIRDALQTLESEGYLRIQQAVFDWMRGRGQNAVFATLQMPAPTDAPQADSALVSRYVGALLDAIQPEDLQTDVFESVLRSLSPETRASLAPGIVQTVRSASKLPDAATQRVSMTRLTRLQLAQADPADIRALTTYYESEAGRYVGRRLFSARSRASRDAIREALEYMSDREMAEVQPELIGGLAELQSLVVYPYEARQQGIEGSVVVQMVVNERGEPTDLVVVRTPSPLLSEAALDAVRQIRFVPGMHRGRPVKVRFAVPVTFSFR